MKKRGNEKEKKITHGPKEFFSDLLYKITAAGASVYTMSCKIENFFAALKEHDMPAALTDSSRSLADFISTFELKTCWNLSRFTDEQIQSYYIDDAQAFDEMINLRNHFFWGDKKARGQSGAVAVIVNDDDAPVTVSGWLNYYHWSDRCSLDRPVCVLSRLQSSVRHAHACSHLRRHLINERRTDSVSFDKRPWQPGKLLCHNPATRMSGPFLSTTIISFCCSVSTSSVRCRI